MKVSTSWGGTWVRVRSRMRSRAMVGLGLVVQARVDQLRRHLEVAEDSIGLQAGCIGLQAAP